MSVDGSSLNLKPGQECEVYTYGLNGRWNRVKFCRLEPAAQGAEAKLHFEGEAGAFVVPVGQEQDRVRCLD